MIMAGSASDRMLDTSVFKRLSHNDTGAARGHQGGIVIPKGIAQFFPPLPAVTAKTGPTVDAILTADLFVDGGKVATVETRYQHQTWGGTRSPERRLTDNLGALRNAASEDDIVLFTKDLNEDAYLQIHLIRQGTPEYARLDSVLGEQRSGPLDPSDPPVSVEDIRDAEEYVDAMASEPPAAFGPERAFSETKATRRARDRAFRQKVLQLYGFRCAFTDRSFASPLSEQLFGLDAAHVVPVHARGTDHPANGVALAKDVHWAFDRGLVGIGDDRRIIVPRSVQVLPGNEFLRDLHGRQLNEANAPGMRVLDDALAWHRENVLIQDQ